LIASCPICGHRWLNRTEAGQAAVEAATFKPGYVGYRDDPAYVRSVSTLIQSSLMERVPPPATLLDIGCGAGDFMAVAKGFGYEVEGVDISPTSAEICRSRGLMAVAADFLTHDFGKRFDLIVMWDVIAHLRDPAAFLERIHSLLTGRGILLMKTPTFGDLSVNLSNRLPRLSGTLLGAPSHSQYFKSRSLSALLARTGFEASPVEGGAARSPLTGGSAKQKLARRFRQAIARLSGDANAYVLARPS
jgi:SAM-dependent methyltransferase